MAERVAPIVSKLEPADVYLLSGIEQGMRFSEWVDRKKLPEFAGIDAEEIDYRLNRTTKWGLIERKTIQYEGYRLTFDGYDALALYTFVSRNTIDGFGESLGVGKESDVFEVRSYKPMALKFHREGYTNFRSVNRDRDYTADHEHVSWLYTARQAAEREYEALERLYSSVSVPRPIDQNRHAIIMEKMDGVELSRTELAENVVPTVLQRIISELSAAYSEGVVHADMSEYNVFVSGTDVTVFDWPQSIPIDHPNADELLRRDLTNLFEYFRRKYPHNLPKSVDVEELAGDVQAGTVEKLDEYTRL